MNIVIEWGCEGRTIGNTLPEMGVLTEKGTQLVAV